MSIVLVKHMSSNFHDGSRRIFSAGLFYKVSLEVGILHEQSDMRRPRRDQPVIPLRIELPAVSRLPG